MLININTIELSSILQNSAIEKNLLTSTTPPFCDLKIISPSFLSSFKFFIALKHDYNTYSKHSN